MDVLLSNCFCKTLQKDLKHNNPDKTEPIIPVPQKSASLPLKIISLILNKWSSRMALPGGL